MGFNILVADDNSDDHLLLSRGFKKAGVNALLRFTNDGAEAVQYLSGRGHFKDRTKYPFPDIILLDVKMPGLDGFEVLKWLRGQTQIGLLPVIMLTSSDEPRDIDRAHSLGANGYLMKPSGTRAMQQMLHGIEAFWVEQHRFPTCCPCSGIGRRHRCD